MRTSIASIPSAQLQSTVSTVLVEALARLGVTHAFGVMGGALAPFFHALAHSEIATFHLRHEAGAAFAACEASIANRRPVLVFTTAGPGVTNALTGMLAARWDGAHVILVSAATAANYRGRIATQETSPITSVRNSMTLPGDAFHYAVTIEHPAQLATTMAQIATGLANPGGFIAHVSLPIDMQRTPCPPIAHLGDRRGVVPSPAPSIIDEHAARFAAEPPVIWLGFGARHAAGAIRELAERLGARVMCSPRGKGIFPEDHPRFLGVTGVGGHTRVEELLGADPPLHTLVLGTRMGEGASFWARELTPAVSFVHVDTDPTAFGAAYPDVTTEPVLAEVGAYVNALLAALGTRPHRTMDSATRPGFRDRARFTPRATGGVRPQVLLDAMQRLLVDGTDAWLMAESGNAFCWSSHLLQYREPNRYRVSTTFGSMGHAATGVVGAALARRGKAVALVGDGAMMMLNELHAAVQHRANALWIVLNDACYLICAQGMKMMGWEPFSCDLPRVDFVGLAKAIGADGERVTTELEVDAALARALAATGPFVLDVTIDPREQPPSGRRNNALMQQGKAATESSHV